MGKWTHGMIHCSATPEGREVTPDDIKKWHIDGRGWSRVGYSILWPLIGSTEILIPFDEDDVIESWEISNGARGWNGRTKHFCYAGGTEKHNIKNSKDTRIPEQLAAMEATIKMITVMNPDIKWIGHNQVARKACPSFSVPEFCLSIGIPRDNIDFNKYYK